MLPIAVSTEIVVTLAKEAASAIGSGVVVGSFLGATDGFTHGRSRKQLERDALRDGYIGGGIALTAWLISLCNVYTTSL